MSAEQYGGVDHSDRSLGDLVSDLTSDLSAMVRDHLELAKAEIREDVKEATRAGGMFGGAGLAGIVALIALSLAAGWGLAEVMAPGWAFLIVGGFWAVIAGALALMGKQRADRMEPGPRATIEEIKEDQQWIANKKS